MPYSCLEVDCSSNSENFPTRQQWIKHLQSVHHAEVTSPSRKCHMCGKMTGIGVIQICKHFADHLEDIAIASTPMIYVSDDDSETGSLRSHRTSREGLDGLETIAEEAEENQKPSRKAGATGPGAHGNDELSPAAEDSEDQTHAQPFLSYENTDYAPNCAICNEPADIKCECESERLQLAVQAAEKRVMDEKIADIRCVSISIQI